ncbi:MAG TPA: sugar O-acetyltransferase [Chitinophagaceae bacterium]|nr:sugar O-acetyltransferase [Chitinophagaceae bacterium]
MPKMDLQHRDIFQRLLNGEAVPFNHPDYFMISNACNETREMLVRLNAATHPEEIRNLVSKITGSEVDGTTIIFPPFQINYGKNTRMGRGVFINFDCTFLDLGGITIDDNVMLGPKVSLLSEGHPVAVNDRQTLTTGSIHIKRNVWIGANATILQGVTIGENSVVAAGAVVSKSIPANTVVGGVPARHIKNI